MPKKSMSLLHAKSKSKKPVEDTVRSNLSDIQIALDNGHSLAEIREALEQDGHHVGSQSGFNTALRRVGKELADAVDPVALGTDNDRKQAAPKPKTDAIPPVTSTGDTSVDRADDRPTSAATVGDARPSTDAIGTAPPATAADAERANAPLLSPFVDNRFKPSL